MDSQDLEQEQGKNNQQNATLRTDKAQDRTHGLKRHWRHRTEEQINKTHL